jgi:hypothetical protein
LVLINRKVVKRLRSSARRGAKKRKRASETPSEVKWIVKYLGMNMLIKTDKNGNKKVLNYLSLPIPFYFSLKKSYANRVEARDGWESG